MNKNQFLNELEKTLRGFSPEERRDIMYDYEEHFRIGTEEGKSEEAIAKELGDPSVIVKQYTTSEPIEIKENSTTTSNTVNSFIAAIGLIIFNLIFVLGPYVGVVATIISFFVVSFALVLSGIVLILSPLAPQLVSIPINIPYSALFFFGIGIGALGTLFFIGAYYAGKLLRIISAKYIKFNLRVINPKGGSRNV